MRSTHLFVPFLLAFGVTLHAQPVPVTVHADQVVGEIRPIWNYFGYDEAGTTLTREGRHLLGELNTNATGSRAPRRGFGNSGTNPSRPIGAGPGKSSSRSTIISPPP
jgi:hypothetical protein